jgi:hypothetical protein
MKNVSKSMALTVSFALISLYTLSCTKTDSLSFADQYGQFSSANLNSQIALLPFQSISDAEKISLLHMREEEKLARDVYITLYNKHGVKVFDNISMSEQTHTDAILQLLTKYSIIDPVGANGIGVFTDTSFQILYNTLVASGSVSIIEAYKVGTTIEDLDLFDLKNDLLKVDNQDIILVYQLLSKGSRNHMRSFYGNLKSLGFTYVPQFITQSDLDAIINSAIERGF